MRKRTPTGSPEAMPREKRLHKKKRPLAEVGRERKKTVTFVGDTYSEGGGVSSSLRKVERNENMKKSVSRWEAWKLAKNRTRSSIAQDPMDDPEKENSYKKKRRGKREGVPSNSGKEGT